MHIFVNKIEKIHIFLKKNIEKVWWFRKKAVPLQPHLGKCS